MELFEKLSLPLRYHWRVQGANANYCTFVAYINARDVMARLDLCLGAYWQSDFKDVKGVLYAGIGISLDKGQTYIWKWDAGTESNIEKEKGESSDAFKRAAIKIGIGRFLYDLGSPHSKSTEGHKGKYLPSKISGGPIINPYDVNDFAHELSKNNRMVKYNNVKMAIIDAKDTDEINELIEEIIRQYDGDKTGQKEELIKFGEDWIKDMFDVEGEEK